MCITTVSPGWISSVSTIACRVTASYPLARDFAEDVTQFLPGPVVKTEIGNRPAGPNSFDESPREAARLFVNFRCREQVLALYSLVFLRFDPVFHDRFEIVLDDFQRFAVTPVGMFVSLRGCATPFPSHYPPDTAVCPVQAHCRPACRTDHEKAL